MRFVMTDESGAVLKAAETGSDLLKAHVKGYTRKDGTFVKEHDDNRQAAQGKLADGHDFGAMLGAMKDGDAHHFANSAFNSEKLKVEKKGDRFHFRTSFGAKDGMTHEEAAQALGRLHGGGASPASRNERLVHEGATSGGGATGEVEKVAHPKGHKPGANVYFPHPDKPGKKALGKYVGQRDGKAVVSHKDHGEVEVDNGAVSAARGVPKTADPEASKAAGNELRAEQAKTREHGFDHPNVIGKAQNPTNYAWSKETGARPVPHKGGVTEAHEFDFAGRKYMTTGKTGESMHDKTPVRAFEAEDGQRVWVDDAGRVHADSRSEVPKRREEYLAHLAEARKTKPKGGGGRMSKAMTLLWRSVGGLTWGN